MDERKEIDVSITAAVFPVFCWKIVLSFCKLAVFLITLYLYINLI